MKINVTAVGKIKEKFFKDAVDEYAKRISRYCVFSVTECPEASPSKSEDERRQIEGKSLLDKAKGKIIALDGGGEEISSRELAELIERYTLAGASELSFIIGGSNGLSKEVLSCADKRISFGKMTYPHQLFRVMLTEQIYRAFAIINNTPYHK